MRNSDRDQLPINVHTEWCWDKRFVFHAPVRPGLPVMGYCPDCRAVTKVPGFTVRVPR